MQLGPLGNGSLCTNLRWIQKDMLTRCSFSPPFLFFFFYSPIQSSLPLSLSHGRFFGSAQSHARPSALCRGLWGKNADLASRPSQHTSNRTTKICPWPTPTSSPTISPNSSDSVKLPSPPPIHTPSLQTKTPKTLTLNLNPPTHLAVNVLPPKTLNLIPPTHLAVNALPRRRRPTMEAASAGVAGNHPSGSPLGTRWWVCCRVQLRLTVGICRHHGVVGGLRSPKRAAWWGPVEWGRKGRRVWGWRRDRRWLKCPRWERDGS